MKVYVASKWEEIETVRDIYEQLRNRNHEVSYDWTKYKEHEHTEERAIKNIEGVKYCDLLIAYMKNDYVYKGVYAEIGAALVLNTEVYIIGEVEGVFMHHPLVTRFSTVSEVMSFLDTYELRKKLEYDIIRYEELKGIAIADDKNARKKTAALSKKIIKTELLLRTMGWEACIKRDKVSYDRIGNSNKQEVLT